MLNILAILAVIALHCNGIVHSNPNNKAWTTSLIIESFFYWAVPVFLMLSGATLLKYRERYDTKAFFKKRILKVAIPFTVWSILILIWKINTKQINLEYYKSIIAIINTILNNRQEETYYFMIDILGIYLTMPLLSLLAKEENRKTLWFTVLLYFVFNATFSNILPIVGIEYNNKLTVQIGGYIVYVLLGYLLSTEDLSKKQKVALYIFAFIGLLYRFLTTFLLSKHSGQVIKITWGYTSWHCILLTCSVFIFVKGFVNNNSFKENKRFIKILNTVSSCSFGIYLVHKMIMYYQIVCFNINTSSWQWRTIGVLTTYCISLLIIYVLKKIPVIKKIIP